jgi:hypothetical protein
VSATAKLYPETRIFAPATPEDGVTVTVAVTVKVTEIDPCCTRSVPFIVIKRDPPLAVETTTYVPVRTPELLIWHAVVDPLMVSKDSRIAAKHAVLPALFR